MTKLPLNEPAIQVWLCKLGFGTTFLSLLARFERAQSLNGYKTFCFYPQEINTPRVADLPVTTRVPWSSSWPWSLVDLGEALKTKYFSILCRIFLENLVIFILTSHSSRDESWIFPIIACCNCPLYLRQQIEVYFVTISRKWDFLRFQL